MFEGFPRAGLEFLAELGRHNDRDWFEAHRAAWDEQIVPAMLAWCGALCERLSDVMPRLVFVPRGGGSLYAFAELSRYKGLTVGKRIVPGAWLHSREALRRSEAAARAYAPLHTWLRDELCR